MGQLALVVENTFPALGPTQSYFAFDSHHYLWHLRTSVGESRTLLNLRVIREMGN